MNRISKAGQPSTQVDHSTDPHVVYRAYNDDGVLLYVGYTWHLDRRLVDHQADRADWANYARRITVEEFPDQASAHAAEIDAIKSERPIFNMLGLGRIGVRYDAPVVSAHDPDADWIARVSVKQASA